MEGLDWNKRDLRYEVENGGLKHVKCGKIMTLYECKSNPKAAEFYCSGCHVSISVDTVRADQK